jgi:hypothetical protein
MEEHKQAPKINLITPPDKLHNFHVSFCLVYPSSDIKSQFQNLIENFEDTINVYMYEQQDDQMELDWLLDVVKYSQYVVLDIDNIPPSHRDLIPYLIGFNNVFWLTKGENIVYNSLSNNRIYNLDWLYEHIGGPIETQL